MFFGLPPLKQNSAVGSAGRSYLPPPSVFENLVGSPPAVAPLKEKADAKLQLSKEVKVTVDGGATVVAGRQVMAVLADARRQFNVATTLQGKQQAWMRAQRTFDAANKLGYLEKGANGYVQNAATYLGVGYDGIKAPAPPSTSGVGAKGATGDVTQVLVPPSSSSQPNGSPGVIADVNQLFALAGESLNVTNTPSANREALQDEAATFLQNSAPLYQEELFGIRNMATMAQVDAKYRLPPEFFSRAANVLSSSEETISPDQVKEIQPLTLLRFLARNGGPDAKNVAIELLNALRKPTGQTESNVASGSQVPLVPSEDDGAPIAGVPSEYA
jgi:hypothetical protein